MCPSVEISQLYVPSQPHLHTKLLVEQMTCTLFLMISCLIYALNIFVSQAVAE